MLCDFTHTWVLILYTESSTSGSVLLNSLRAERLVPMLKCCVILLTHECIIFYTESSASRPVSSNSLRAEHLIPMSVEMEDAIFGTHCDRFIREVKIAIIVNVAVS